VGYYAYLLAYSSVKRSDSNQLSNDERAAVELIIELLKNFLTKCKDQLTGLELQKFLFDLYDATEYPVMSMVILKWLRRQLLDPEWYDDVNNFKGLFDIYLDLLNEVTLRQSLQRGEVFSLLVDLFTVETSLDALSSSEIKKKLVESWVYLLECGYVLPVLSLASNWTAKGVDLSLIRHFVVQVLNVTTSPYSDEFIHLTLQIIHSLGNSSLEIDEYRVSLEPFLDYCVMKKQRLPLPLFDVAERLRKQIDQFGTITLMI
jgi:hypothetical protein